MTRMPQTHKPIRGRNSLTRFPGICQEAAKLGVDRRHLYFVCTGERESPRIQKSAWYIRVTGKKPADTQQP
jgi:hypothetical protein